MNEFDAGTAGLTKGDRYVFESPGFAGTFEATYDGFRETTSGPELRLLDTVDIRPDGTRRDSMKVYGILRHRITSATRLAPELAEVWCSRCELPSTIVVGREAACPTHGIIIAAERLLAAASDGEDLGTNFSELEEALALFAPVQNPSPDVERAAAETGAYAL